MEPIYYWKYSLKANMRLNAVSSRREFEGALLRIGEGFGCLLQDLQGIQRVDGGEGLGREREGG